MSSIHIPALTYTRPQSNKLQPRRTSLLDLSLSFIFESDTPQLVLQSSKIEGHTSSQHSQPTSVLWDTFRRTPSPKVTSFLDGPLLLVQSSSVPGDAKIFFKDPLIPKLMAKLKMCSFYRSKYFGTDILAVGPFPEDFCIWTWFLLGEGMLRWCGRKKATCTPSSAFEFPRLIVF